MRNIQTIIGLDIGRSAVKAVAYANGEYFNVEFPSVVSPAITISDEPTLRQTEPETVTVDGDTYFTGETARLQGNVGTSVGLSHEWTASPEYRALVASALKRFDRKGVSGMDNPYLVIGTPSALFGTQNHQIAMDTKRVINADIKVLPQPAGAYFDFVLDKNGVPIKDKLRDEDGNFRNWAIVEIGHFTTDFMLMIGGQNIERASSSCEGMNFAGENLSRILLNTRNIHASTIECERAIRTGKIKQFSDVIIITKEIEEAVSYVVKKIISKAESLLSTEVAKLDGVLIAGGGANLVAHELKKKWPHVIPLRDPKMSVANGYCRYGLGVLMGRAAREANS